MLNKVIARLLKLSLRGFNLSPVHLTRFTMYDRLSNFALPRAEPGMQVLSISDSLPLVSTLGLGQLAVTVANYPDYNILSLPFGGDSFDFAVTDQVLEHVAGDPQSAADEVWRILKPGGWAIHATCMLLPVHGAPSDYWRFTTEGLRLLCRRFSRIVTVGSWGNPCVPALIASGLQFQKVPLWQHHPFHRLAIWNRPDWPTVVWVIAEK